MRHHKVIPLRRLERLLFRAWCGWLCYRNAASDEKDAAKRFEAVITEFEKALATHQQGPWLLGDTLTTADVVFVPYLERMNASLFYYKGYRLRDQQQRPHICAWFEALEQRSSYLGGQSDFHTHAHDLPPQMGGCYESGDKMQQMAKRMVDARTGDDRFALLETTAPVLDDAKLVAANRCWL